ncbi:MAG: ABC transporter ATP-binding protein [bacterium]
MMLELKEIKKDYGPVRAVAGIDLSLEKGKIMVILGPSGCGKTTLLRLIAGFERPDAGCIYIDGQMVSNHKVMIPPNRRGLGMIFQDLALWPHMTARENINFGLKGMGFSKRQREDKIKKNMEFVKLSNHLNRYPHQLSGGERQRLALARTISLEPRIILMDEPLTNLDPRLRSTIRDVILRLNKELQASILYVTHNYEDATLLADRIAVMKQGRIEKIGLSSEVL